MAKLPDNITASGGTVSKVDNPKYMLMVAQMTDPKSCKHPRVHPKFSIKAGRPVLFCNRCHWEVADLPLSWFITVNPNPMLDIDVSLGDFVDDMDLDDMVRTDGGVFQ